MTNSPSKQLLWLDLLRGMAAFLVLIGHLRSITFVDFNQLEHPGIFTKSFYFITSLGHEAVMIFFVLSGFFIIKSIVETIGTGKWSWKNYAVNRLSRLWVVLIPGLLLGMFWDNLGLHFFSDSYIYTGQIETIKYWINPNGKLGADVFIGNLFFLQTVFFPPFGSNGALWSLSNEFWYYAVFPLMYMFFTSLYTPIKRFIFAFVGASIMLLLNHYTFTPATHLTSYFFIWLMGGITFYFHKNHAGYFQNKLLAVVLLMIMMVVLFFISMKKYPLLFNDFSLGILCLLLVAFLANFEMKFHFLKKVSAFLSNISYTLYVVHLPFIVFITSYLRTERIPFDTNGLLEFVAIVGVVIIYAWVVYYIFERNTYKVKRLFK